MAKRSKAIPRYKYEIVHCSILKTGATVVFNEGPESVCAKFVGRIVREIKGSKGKKKLALDRKRIKKQYRRLRKEVAKSNCSELMSFYDLLTGAEEYTKSVKPCEISHISAENVYEEDDQVYVNVANSINTSRLSYAGCTFDKLLSCALSFCVEKVQ